MSIPYTVHAVSLNVRMIVSFVWMMETSFRIYITQGLPPMFRPDALPARIEHVLRAKALMVSPFYVSIISNLASNSCPQAVQWMQSDSTTSSSNRIPMPPQSGQRTRWTRASFIVSY